MMGDETGDAASLALRREVRGHCVGACAPGDALDDVFFAALCGEEAYTTAI